MSFFKIITQKINGTEIKSEISTDSAADILTKFITVNKKETWLDAEFNLDAINITYSDENPEAILSAQSSEPIVDFETLKSRFDKIFTDLKKRGIIDDSALDLWGVDETNPHASIYGWRPAPLAIALDFIATIIEEKESNGSVTF